MVVPSPLLPPLSLLRCGLDVAAVQSVAWGTALPACRLLNEEISGVGPLPAALAAPLPCPSCCCGGSPGCGVRPPCSDSAAGSTSSTRRPSRSQAPCGSAVPPSRGQLLPPPAADVQPLVSGCCGAAAGSAATAGASGDHARNRRIPAAALPPAWQPRQLGLGSPQLSMLASAAAPGPCSDRLRLLQGCQTHWRPHRSCRRRQVGCWPQALPPMVRPPWPPPSLALPPRPAMARAATTASNPAAPPPALQRLRQLPTPAPTHAQHRVRP